MKILSLIITCLLISVLDACSDRKPKEVLFIGNSLTYYHDMPVMLQAMLNEKDIRINIHQSTFPGVSLSAHLAKPQTDLRKVAKSKLGFCHSSGSHSESFNP